MKITAAHPISVDSIKQAASQLTEVVEKTPLSFSARLSEKYDAQVYLKREDLQAVRSYKIRGAYHKIASLTASEQQKGIVCASAGNHAQGVALSCKLLKIDGVIYMPATTPQQKIEQVRMFGGTFITVKLEGDTFDDAFELALAEGQVSNRTFIHPFDDPKIIEGQATVGLEILQQTATPLDYIFVPIGGGGLSAGLSYCVKQLSPQTKIIGVEPAGAPAMKESLEAGKQITLSKIDKFVDGAAVKTVGKHTFELCQSFLDTVVTVSEGKICETILELYNKDAIVVEPAGAMSIAVLNDFEKAIKNKRIACVVSGSNNDITRTAEIKERALLHSNLKHYFIVTFPQRAGALRQFVEEVLGPTDDITHFEYTKKTNRENGSAVVGLELQSPDDLKPLIAKMKQFNFYGDYLNNKPELFQFLV